MSQPFRDNEDSVREQASRLAGDLYHLEHQLRIARTALERVEDRLRPIQTAVFSATTALFLAVGVIAGFALAKALVEGVPVVVSDCAPRSW